MTEEKDKGIQKAADHVVYGSSSPTPAASSAGASSPAIPANMTSVDWCGLGKDLKGVSRSNAQPPWSSATSGSTVRGSNPDLAHSICRPWDRGDFLKRLSTFKSEIWRSAPKACGPLACARRGWMNVDDDVIACEACGVHLRFPCYSSWSQDQVGTYDEQLDTGHKSFCPWKGNPCAESLAQFLPSPISALVGGFNDRCDALLQFSTLPIISGSAIDEMKITRGLEVDRLLSKPVRETVKRLDDSLIPRNESIDTASIPYFQAQRLISLCGWEPRILPNVVDCEEHSAYSARKEKSVSPGEGPSNGLQEPSSRTTGQAYDPKSNLASAVLDCSLCGASVKLKSYATASCPFTFMLPGLTNASEAPQKSLLRNMSAASGVEGWHGNEAPLKEKESDLPNHEPATGSQQFIVQPEGSEMGGRAASYESFGPGFAGYRMDEGGSTIDRPQSRMHRADSIEGTVLDFEGDEVDDGEVGRRRSYIGESSKRKRGGESSSRGLRSSYTPTETDYEVDDTERLKKKRREEILEELQWSRSLPALPPGSSLHASSVIAVDTCNSKDENSMDSVENYPQDDDLQGAAFSWEKSERVVNEDLNYIEQAQQSTCHQGNAGALAGPSDPGVSTSDEGDLDIAVEYDGGAAPAMGHGVSVGMSGGSVQMGASHEAEIHGADVSVHKMDSLANDAELITEVTDVQNKTSESVPGQALTRQALPDDAKQQNTNEYPVDSVEAVPSVSVGKVHSSAKHEDSGQEESWEGKQKGSQGSLGEKLAEANNVVNNAVPQLGPRKSGVRVPIAHAEGKRRGRKRSKEQGDEFDPIHEHHFYCPWVNRYVAAAGGSGQLSFPTFLCGWQLTIDALDALQMQSSTYVGPMESESAASMHRGNFTSHELHGKQSSSKKTVG